MLACSRTKLLHSLVLSAAGLVAGCSSSQAGGSSGVSAQDVTGGPMQVPAPSWAKETNFAGRVDSAKQVSLQVHLAMHNVNEAKALLKAVTDPDSASYGHFLSDADFAAKFAPTAADVTAVRAHLEANGLKVTHIPSNNAFINVEGTAAQVETAFSTRLGQYQVSSEVRQAAMDPIALPAAVSGKVLTVLGIATPARAKTNVAYVEGKSPEATAATAACSEWFGKNPSTGLPYGGGYPNPLSYYECGYRPAQLRQAYGLESIIRGGNDGTGQTVAIVDAFTSPTLVLDAQTYAANNDGDYPLLSSQIKVLAGPGTVGTIDTGWYGEQSLDVEAVHAMAPGANIVYVGGASANDPDLLGALNMIISGRLATVISNSWGGLEMQTTDFVAWQSVAIQAGLKGIGLYFASGDSGDNSVDNAPNGPTPNYPASLAEVTAVGGTSLALGATGERMFEVGWESGLSRLTYPDAGVDAAPTYVPGGAGNFYFGAGGGVSGVYLQPTYQAGIVPPAVSNFMGATARTIPDVAMLADPYTGFLIGQTSTTTGIYGESGIGGTSLATPMFAGTVALAQQYTGKKLGAANAAFYKASKKSAFTDIKPGALEAVQTLRGNVITFDYHGPDNTNATAVGYDTVTGVGVPNGVSFLKALK